MSKQFWIWTAVLLVGIAIVVAYPYLSREFAPFDSGMFPEWILPVGYLISVIGAAGMFIAWVRRRARN